MLLTENIKFDIRFFSLVLLILLQNIPKYNKVKKYANDVRSVNDLHVKRHFNLKMKSRSIFRSFVVNSTDFALRIADAFMY